MNVRDVSHQQVLFPIALLVSVMRAMYTRDFSVPIAEDFSDLLLQGLENPYSIHKPVVDGLLLFPRLLALVALSLSKEFAPNILVCLSCAFHAFVATYIFRKSFSDHFPHLYSRVLICLLIIFGPGSTEIVGNAVYTHYLAILLLVLFAIEELDWNKTGLLRKLFTVLLIFSTNISFALIIFYLLLNVSNQNKQFFFHAVASCLSMIYSLFLGATSTAQLSTARNFEQLTEGKLELLWKMMFDWFPPHDIFVTIVHLFACIAVVLSYILASQEKGLSRKVTFLSFGLLSVAMTYSLGHSYARPYHSGDLTNRARMLQLIPFYLTALLLLEASLRDSASRRLTKTIRILAVFMLIGVSLVLSQVGLKLTGPDRWIVLLRKLRSLEDGEKLSFGIGPIAHSNVYWGTVECWAFYSVRQCKVKGGNGEQRIFNFSTSELY